MKRWKLTDANGTEHVVECDTLHVTHSAIPYTYSRIVAVELLPEPAPMPVVVFVPTGRPVQEGQHYMTIECGDMTMKLEGSDSRPGYVRREVALREVILAKLEEDMFESMSWAETADAIARAIEGRDA